MTEDDKIQLKENTRLTREIHGALVGSLGNPGLIQQHHQLKKDHETLAAKFWVATGAGSGLLIAWEVFKFLATKST